MKLEKTSIKLKLFFYLAIFAAVILVMLWFLQIVFLDDFYKQIKISSIKASAEQIESNIDTDNLSALLNNIYEQNQTYIRIISEDGTSIYSSGAAPDSLIHRMPGGELYEIFKKTQQNGGTLLELRSSEPWSRVLRERRLVGEVPKPMDRINQSIIYSKIVKMNNGTSAVLILNSTITPVNATVDTLRVQLKYVTVITLLLALGLAIIISKRISKPIIKINKTAKELAKGKYDITFDGRGYLEITELSDTLNYAAMELSKVEGLRRELIANISHDLRTPLTMITGYGEIIRDLPGENTPRNIQVIIDEARRLTTLVNDILDISKLQSGTQKLTVEHFNLTQCIREILKRYTRLTEQEGYNLSFRSESEAWVTADALKISQVIYNLINNAITYTGEDKSVDILQICSNETVRIEISDRGQGIPEEQLPLIWDRYYKIDKAHKRAAIGTGLGLSIVKAVLEMHQADFGVVSTPGSGSTFWFELRLDKPEES